MGGLLTHDNMTISCFSKKLTPAQQNYTVTDKELLAVCEALKHNHNIIFGSEVTIRTDHKNLCQDDTKHT